MVDRQPSEHGSRTVARLGDSTAVHLLTTFVPVARTLPAMSAYRAVPPRFGSIHQDRTPEQVAVGSA